MNWLDFTQGFWHVFGAHAGESRDAIIARKQREIRLNQWTLWSFQFRKSMDIWRAQLSDSRSVYVLCSDSPCAIDPSSSPTRARFYRTALHSPWVRIPKAVSVPHPARSKGRGSAFMVERILTGEEIRATPPIRVRWFCTTDRSWRVDPLPTRGEYLIQSPGLVKLRPIYVILVLRSPYVVEITADELVAP